MKESLCANPLETSVLSDYWLAALSPAEEELVEEHLLGCDACGSRLRDEIALGEGIRKLARHGRVRVIMSESFLNCAAREGLRVRQYSPPAGGGVDCTVGLEDDLLIARLPVDLAGARRVDMCFCDAGGTEQLRFRDVPVNPEQRGVIFNEPIIPMRAAPAMVLVVKLVAVEEATERLLGQYTFNHSPS